MIKVYGDELPSDGLIVSPTELKKLLKPFKEGEPNEKLLIEDFKFIPLPLNNNNACIFENSDITEIKNGPILCITSIDDHYRQNFRNFNINLKNGNRDLISPLPLPPQDISNVETIVAKAFGKNNLLLRSDRCGLPYKRVPKIFQNNYSPRFIL